MKLFSPMELTSVERTFARCARELKQKEQKGNAETSFETSTHRRRFIHRGPGKSVKYAATFRETATVLLKHRFVVGTVGLLPSLPTDWRELFSRVPRRSRNIREIFGRVERLIVPRLKENRGENRLRGDKLLGGNAEMVGGRKKRGGRETERNRWLGDSTGCQSSTTKRTSGRPNARVIVRYDADTY